MPLANINDVQLRASVRSNGGYGASGPSSCPARGRAARRDPGDWHIQGYGTKAETAWRLPRGLPAPAPPRTRGARVCTSGVGGWNAVNECQYVRRRPSSRPSRGELTGANDPTIPRRARLRCARPSPARASARTRPYLVYPAQFTQQGVSTTGLGPDWQPARYAEVVAPSPPPRRRRRRRALPLGDPLGGHEPRCALVGERVSKDAIPILPSSRDPMTGAAPVESDSHLNRAGYERGAGALWRIRSAVVSPDSGADPGRDRGARGRR